MKNLAFVLSCLCVSGCATMPRDGEGWFGSYYRQKMESRGGYISGHYRPIPVAPSNVGFNRPPVHWHSNVFQFQIRNETRQHHVRCVIDGQEHQRTVRGAVLRAYVRTASGLQPMALIPPGESTYLISDGEQHNMRCELYGGPVQVLPNGAYVFKKLRQKWIRDFTPDQFPNHTYSIYDLEILNYEKV